MSPKTSGFTVYINPGTFRVRGGDFRETPNLLTTTKDTETVRQANSSRERGSSGETWEFVCGHEQGKLSVGKKTYLSLFSIWACLVGIGQCICYLPETTGFYPPWH